MAVIGMFWNGGLKTLTASEGGYEGRKKLEKEGSQRERKGPF